ncbi:hypothetical protein [Thioalkalivibrio thiocyanodenitrificans]|uniref:hypothetical protein n=1 Tax=Thioalkalivibrio thiocyanodenitrificans TaxID=243063 RepID=UPI00036C8F0F|nr:hypothetical protein [Thioalkalivibrio thiocyanodenitrificans]
MPDYTILMKREPAVEGGSECANFYWEAPNGRIFRVREFEDSAQAYFLEEMCPSGRRFSTDASGNHYDFRDDPVIERLLGDPNSFRARLNAAGISEDEVIYVGAGLGMGTIYYATLDACKAAIEAALESNTWYSGYSKELAEQQSAEYQRSGRAAAERQAWEDSKRALREQAMQEPGFFKGCHNMFGPLSKEIKAEILSYINEPSCEQWNRIYSLMVSSTTTLWQAWVKFDPSAPTSLPAGTDGEHRWPRIPEPETLIEAIKKAASQTD